MAMAASQAEELIMKWLLCERHSGAGFTELKAHFELQSVNVLTVVVLQLQR